MTAALADDLGDVVVTVAVFARQRLIARRLFQRIEIGALHVLDDGELECFAVARFERHDRYVVQPRALRRAPAPFAGDDLVGVLRPAHGTHDHRLDDAALPDRRGQIVELEVGKVAPRIARIGTQEFDGHAALLPAALGRAVFGRVSHESGKAAAQSRSAILCHDGPRSKY